MAFRAHRLFRCAPEETPERWSDKGDWRVVVGDPEMLALAPWEWRWDDAERLRESGELVKRGPPRTVVRAQVRGREVYLKRHLDTRLAEKLRHAFATCAALEEFRLGRELLRRGIATARPLLAAVRKGAWPGREGIIVTEALPGAPLVPFFLGLDVGDERASFLTELARGLAELHDTGFRHGSLGGHHVLVEKGPRFALIDVHSSSFGLPWRVGPRSLNLYSLAKTLRPRVTPGEWDGFLRAYASASRRGPPLAALKLALFIRHGRHAVRGKRGRG